MADLREWLGQVREAGELRTVCGADPVGEIGALTEINDSRRGPALLFEEIPGYPSGHRLLSSALVSSRRLGLALGMPASGTIPELLDSLAGKPRQWEEEARRCAPRTVSSGPVMENVLDGSAVDLLRFPAPQWNEQDGGRYLGTGDVVITRDPETDSVNLGTYRVMVHDRTRLGLYISPSHHGYRHLQMYHSRGEACPVAISFGHHPVLLVVGGNALPYGQPEYSYAGAVVGGPIEVIEGPLTGLPFPAGSEMTVEGYVRAGNVLPEGPFGEYTGYYASGTDRAPVVEVEAVYFRDRPVLLGALACRPPHDFSLLASVMKSVLVQEALARAGVTGIQGVWFHESAASNFLVVVSIRQLYPGHARQAGMLAAQCQVAGTGNGRYVVVVDEDIDPTDLEEVVWALGTRTDPATDTCLLRQTFANRLDPMRPGAGDREWHPSRAVLDACRPYERLGTFPAVARSGRRIRERVLRKWPEFG